MRRRVALAVWVVSRVGVVGVGFFVSLLPGLGRCFLLLCSYDIIPVVLYLVDGTCILYLLVQQYLAQRIVRTVHTDLYSSTLCCRALLVVGV